jgi:hypothetical protein
MRKSQPLHHERAEGLRRLRGVENEISFGIYMRIVRSHIDITIMSWQVMAAPLTYVRIIEN